MTTDRPPPAAVEHAAPQNIGDILAAGGKAWERIAELEAELATAAPRGLDTIGRGDEHGWYLADSRDGLQKNVPMYFDGGLCNRDKVEGSVVLYMDEAWANFRGPLVPKSQAPAHAPGEVERLRAERQELLNQLSRIATMTGKPGCRTFLGGPITLTEQTNYIIESVQTIQRAYHDLQEHVESITPDSLARFAASQEHHEEHHKREEELDQQVAKLEEELAAFKSFCPECGCTDLVDFVEQTEPGHQYCAICKQETFTSVSYVKTIAAHLAKLTAAEQRLARAGGFHERTEREVEMLHLLLDDIGAPRTAMGGEGDAEVDINILDRLRWIKANLCDAGRNRLAEAESKLSACAAAIAHYEAALKRREHGDIAADKCVRAVKAALSSQPAAREQVDVVDGDGSQRLKELLDKFDAKRFEAVGYCQHDAAAAWRDAAAMVKQAVAPAAEVEGRNV